MILAIQDTNANLTTCTSGNAQPDKAQDLAEDEEDDGSVNEGEIDHETVETV